MRDNENERKTRLTTNILGGAGLHSVATDSRWRLRTLYKVSCKSFKSVNEKKKKNMQRRATYEPDKRKRASTKFCEKTNLKKIKWRSVRTDAVTDKGNQLKKKQ